MKLPTVFALSALAMGALSGSSVAEGSTATVTDSAGEVAPYWNNHILVAPADDPACKINLRRPHQLSEYECQKYKKGFKGLYITRESGAHDILRNNDCILFAYVDGDCKLDPTIVRRLNNIDGDRCHEVPNPDDMVFYSAKWVCNQDTNDSVHARDVDGNHFRDHVVVTPADGPHCINAVHRDTDTKLKGHCHSFAKPFHSWSATIQHGHKKYAHIGHEDCWALAFSDGACRDNGKKLIELNQATQLGVCHEVDLSANGAGLPGHSWMWTCGDAVDDCLGKPSIKHPKSTSHTITTVLATTTISCMLTTQTGLSTDVSSDVVTKTNVITKTELVTHTHIITNIHSNTMPFSTTFSVCDVEVNTMLY